MMIEWELKYQNLTLYRVSVDTEHFYSDHDTFGSKIAFNLKVESNFNLDNRDLLSIGGEVYWQTDNVNIPSSFMIPVQPINNRRPLIVPMTKQVIQQIEDVRNGGQISLQIALHGICFVPPNHDHQVNGQTRALVDPQFEWLRGRTTTLQSDRHTLVPIHREKWAQLLDGMNFMSYRLVELPILNLGTRPMERWKSVLNRYDNMIQKQRVGNFEDCIEESRLVIDELISVLASHFKVDMGKLKTSGNKVEKFIEIVSGSMPDQKDHWQSFENLLFSITNFSSLYHHAGPRPTLFGNLREQAEHVVMMCSAAVSAVAKMISNK